MMSSNNLLGNYYQMESNNKTGLEPNYSVPMTSGYEECLLYPFDYTMANNTNFYNLEEPMMPVYDSFNKTLSSTPPELTRTNSLESQISSEQIKSMPDTTGLYYPGAGYSFPMNANLPMCPPNGFWPQMSHVNPLHSQKRVFSFVQMSQAKSKKRVRRRFDEIERVFRCIHKDCNKSYGTLNNLNAHIMMQSHGPKRTASEFKSDPIKRC